MLERFANLDSLKEFIRDFELPVVVTRGHLVLAVNDPWLEVLGYRREQIEGRPYLDFMPEEERTRIRRRAELRAKEPQNYQFQRMTSLALKADGRSTIVHVEPTPIPASDGEPFVLNFVFVVPERDAEIELAELLVSTSSRLVCARTVLDVRRTTVEQLAEGTYEAAFFRRDGTAIYPECAALPNDARPELVAEAFERGRPVFVGSEAAAPHAVLVPIPRGEDSELLSLAGRLLGTPLRSALRLFAQGVGSALETAALIGNLERRNQELSDTRAALVRRESLASLGEMAASVAHEVRNPVAVISNAVAMLRRELDGSRSGKVLTIVDEECARLGRMVQDLLDFAKTRPVTAAVESLWDIAEEAIAAARAHPDSASRSVTFHLERKAEVPTVSVDRHLLRQALLNLLINAAQASPEGGVVRVRVAFFRRGDALVPGISVSDEGHGVPESIAGRIFEPFFTTRSQGSGLGLAVVKRIVEALDGAISVETAPRGGASFTLLLPGPLSA